MNRFPVPVLLHSAFRSSRLVILIVVCFIFVIPNHLHSSAEIHDFAQQSATFYESFDTSPGLDETYTDVYQHFGNVLDPDFDTANLGSPAGWGAQCALVYIGPYSGGAGWRQHLAQESTTGYIADISFVLVHNGLKHGKFITIMAAKPQGNPDASFVLFGVFLWKTGFDTHLLFAVGDVNQRVYKFPATGSIAIGAVYDSRVEYNIKTQHYSWTVNGTEVVSDAMPASWADNVAVKYLGSSAGSTGRNSAYLIDNVVWSEIDP
jgi:hypothetical protein